jgi:hypothetical protein
MLKEVPVPGNLCWSWKRHTSLILDDDDRMFELFGVFLHKTFRKEG